MTLSAERKQEDTASECSGLGREVGCRRTLGHSDPKSGPTGRAPPICNQHLWWGKKTGPCSGRRDFFLRKRGHPFLSWKERGRLLACSWEPGCLSFLWPSK